MSKERAAISRQEEVVAQIQAVAEVILLPAEADRTGVVAEVEVEAAEEVEAEETAVVAEVEVRTEVRGAVVATAERAAIREKAVLPREEKVRRLSL